MQAQTKHNNSPFIKLFTGWVIILISYIMIHTTFFIFGFISKLILGGCLATIPYLFGALYFGKSCNYKGTWFYTFGILFPAIIEKIVLYLLSAFLYDISPAKIGSVLEAISNNEPYVTLIMNPIARYFLDVSFFGWVYVLVSLALSVLLVLFLMNNKKTSQQ